MKKRNSPERSENLTVVFTDIVGFAETTASQSRDANARLLRRHDKLLIPIAQKFGGRRVKSIGDALLLVFRSSTDALLCCMAMQDALFEHNRKHSSEPAIHIRTAVNVGEVRVVKGDIFGEAVNIAARLEGVTPRDAIYLTKAVHMTMNRAEVPVEEVGMHRFKGVEDEIQVYQVPRFSTTKLVVEKPIDSGVRPNQPREGFSYPYGGVHLMKFQGHRHRVATSVQQWPWLPISAAGLMLLAAAGYLMWPDADHDALAPEPPAMIVPVPSRPPPPPLENRELQPQPAPLPERSGQRHAENKPPVAKPLARFKIEKLMAEVWPWLLDQRWYIAPARLANAPLPMGSPQPDREAGALPLPWSELPRAEQVLFASLRDSWATLEPSWRRHLVQASRVWRDATKEQRQAVIAEVIRWQKIDGVERNIAARRLDYLRSLDADKRWAIIDKNDLALPLGAAGTTSGVEVRPTPRNIWDRPPGINMSTPPPQHATAAEPYRYPAGPDNQRRYRHPPPPHTDGRRPPPPPRQRDGQPPPPRPPRPY